MQCTPFKGTDEDMREDVQLVYSQYFRPQAQKQPRAGFSSINFGFPSIDISANTLHTNLHASDRAEPDIPKAENHLAAPFRLMRSGSWRRNFPSDLINPSIRSLASVDLFTTVLKRQQGIEAPAKLLWPQFPQRKSFLFRCIKLDSYNIGLTEPIEAEQTS